MEASFVRQGAGLSVGLFLLFCRSFHWIRKAIWEIFSHWCDMAVHIAGQYVTSLRVDDGFRQLQILETDLASHQRHAWMEIPR